MNAATKTKNVNVQDHFLSKICRSGAPVTVFLMNGYQLRGRVRAFDPYMVALYSDEKQQMIYKHAISTITPERPVPLDWEESEQD